jgi:2-hydroxychromene-2-carboxylate isomerase
VSGARPGGPLVVAIDFKQPQSYLAIGPTTKLAAALGLEIDWQPMTARPLQDPPEETVSDDRGARHRRFRARYFERDLHRYAEAQGLVLGDLHRWPDSSVAGMGLLWAKKHAARAGDASIVDAYVHRVFDGYWGGGLALDDAGAIRAVLDTVAGAAADFDPASLRAEYESVLEHWRAAGLVEAPAYVLGEEIFIGRAHLPMIEWLITGKAGPPPV